MQGRLGESGVSAVSCSNGLFPIITNLVYSPIVQLVEHLTVNQYVAGSSPAWGANILCDLVILSHNLKPNQMRSFGSVQYF